MIAAASVPSRRLAAQRIARPPRGAPEDVVGWLGAIQAQDYAASKWAVGLRLPPGAATDAGIERALDEGAILRTHAMRWTWQLVTPADIRWIIELSAARMIARAATRHRQLGIDAATFRRSSAALERALRGGDHLTRPELADVLARAGIDTSEQRLSHLLGRAELDQAIGSGRRRGNQLTWALLDHRAPGGGATLARDDALAALARRYFRSRGPATAADFTWWSGLAPSDARAGLDAIRSELVADTARGRTTWRAARPASRVTATVASPGVRLLPAFDEYLIGYRERSDVLSPRWAKRLNAGGGMLGASVVADGAVVGLWRRTMVRSKVAIDIDLFEKSESRREVESLREAIVGAARRYGAFVGLEVGDVSIAVNGGRLRTAGRSGVR